ncbi:MAG: sigma-70 family RNA polymerase sigma factor [Bacteroidota bacterium]
MRAGGSRTQEEFQREMLPHMDIIYNYSLYLTGNRDDANDLLQETFLKAYRFFNRFEQGTNAKAWLYRIMRNTYINTYRKVKRSPATVEYDEHLSPYRMVPGDADEKMDTKVCDVREIFEDEIAVAIASLPEKYKSVVILRDVENLPYEEVAEALGVPIGTVRSRLHRARGVLSGKLRGYAETRGYEVGASPISGEFALAV